MKKKFRAVFCFISLVLFVTLTRKQTFADSNFNTSFDTTYTVNENGITHVILNGTIQNTNGNVYASFYTVKIGFHDIEHLTATDIKGKVTPITKKGTSEEAITVPFTTKIYGVNKMVTFSLAFDTTDVAKHAGSIWEVNIPGLTDQAEFKDFTVHVKVPSSFGTATYIKPAMSGDSLDFDKESLGASGISIAFGTTQVYDYTLNYQLKNDNLFPVTAEIALPPSTNYQDVTLNDLSPKPENIALDIDGNWLATYYLFPSQKITTVAKGSVYLYLHPKQEKLTQEQKQIYTAEQPYWQTKDPSIQKLAQDLKTPENIYDYVVHHLQYDFTRVAGSQERVGALAVLQHPSSAVCLEFTDLFIALARAAGIPAREIDGYAYTQNQQQRPLSLVKDVLHAWPEYYDASLGEWVMVDPTWENTTKGIDYFHTLDFDHVAFIVKGKNSTYPISPGGYKFSDSEPTKNVFVTFGKNNPLRSPQVTVSFDIPPTLFSGFPITGNLIFRNVSNRLVPPEQVTVSTTSLLPHTQTIFSTSIAPFAYTPLPIKLQATSFLTNAKETITIRVAGNTITRTISVYPFFYQRNYIIWGIIGVIFSIGLFIITTKARNISIFR